MPTAATASPVDRTRTDRTCTALADSCHRLRRLYPDYPRVYAVAAVADEGKRRWWSLRDGVESGRVEQMYARARGEMSSADSAAEVVATSFIHAVVGRVAASIILDGRAWDPGIENLWIHSDNDGGMDWAGVVDTTVRALPGDPCAAEKDVVVLPCEQSLGVWTAHRCVTSLDAVYEKLSECTELGYLRYWSIVGETIIGAATYVPILAEASESDALRRGQGLLDAFTTIRRPVRRQRVA